MRAPKIAAAIFFAIGFHAFAAVPPEYEPLKAEAEKYYSDGSYAKAHDAYEKAKSMDLPAAEMRWVDFRLADTLWRSPGRHANRGHHPTRPRPAGAGGADPRPSRAWRTMTASGRRWRNRWAIIFGRGAIRGIGARRGRITSRRWIGGRARRTSNWPASVI